MRRLKSKEKREKTLWVMWSKNPCVQSIKLQEVEVVGLLTEPSFHMAAYAAEVIPRTQVLLADPLLASWRTASLFLVALCVDNVAPELFRPQTWNCKGSTNSRFFQNRIVG